MRELYEALNLKDLQIREQKEQIRAFGESSSVKSDATAVSGAIKHNFIRLHTFFSGVRANKHSG